MRVTVLGLGLTGESVVRHCVARGDSVTILEDNSNDKSDFNERVNTVTQLGATLEIAPADSRMRAVVENSDLVVPSPGVPEHHPALQAAFRAQVMVRSEIDLAAEESKAVIVAVTGTNGKTTVTTQITKILIADGKHATAAGNIGLPLLDAVGQDWEIIVAEVSSFQLAFAKTFRPKVAVILNLGADHLDWHRTFSAYAHAKAQIFSNQEPSDILVFNADDPVVAGLASQSPSQGISFSVNKDAARGYRVLETALGELLVDDDGEPLVEVSNLDQQRPVDIANALAASAAARAVGASRPAVKEALTEFRGLAHRMELVAKDEGISWYDDSKATNVHATLAAVRGLSDVVLIAGGRNKGVDLSELRSISNELIAVVAIGDASGEIEEVFSGLVPVTQATTMKQAVQVARSYAKVNATVLLSPGCASFDWYSSYAERGDDFARHVHTLIAVKS